jgi:hypothetical protein
MGDKSWSFTFRVVKRLLTRIYELMREEVRERE